MSNISYFSGVYMYVYRPMAPMKLHSSHAAYSSEEQKYEYRINYLRMVIMLNSF